MCCCLISSGNPFRIHSCSRASSGEILSSGFHSKHFFIRSTNVWSLQPTTSLNSTELAILSFPFSWAILQSKFSVKNFFLRSAFRSICFGGGPSTSMNIKTCSFSLSPGKIGKPVNSSTKIHPNDHMSIAGVYLIPNMISGAR